MAIPASVTLYLDWKNGTLASGTYTAVAPDRPVGHTLAFQNATRAVESGSPWNGQTVAKLPFWYSKITSTISSATVATTAGRFLIEVNEQTPSDHVFMVKATNEYMGHFWAHRSGGNLMVVLSWNNEASVNEVVLGTYPTAPYALEVIYDSNHATANQRLRARVWALGGSPGSFVNSTSTTGPAAAMDEFTLLRIGEEEMAGMWYGRVIASNDPDEDLSAVDESAAGSVGEATGSSAVQGLRGSVGGATGTGTATARRGSVARSTSAGAAQAVRGSVGAAAGAAAAVGISGGSAHLGAAAGTANVQGRSGALGTAAGNSTAQALPGAVGRADGAAGVQGLRGSQGTATGAGSAAARAGSLGAAGGTATVHGLRGSIGQATGAGAAAGLSENGSLGHAAGASSVAGHGGSVGRAAGTATLAGYSGTDGLGQAVGAALVEGASGATAAATGAANVIALRGSRGQAAGASSVDGRPANAGHAVGGAAVIGIAGYVGRSGGSSVVEGFTPVEFVPMDPRYRVAARASSRQVIYRRSHGVRP